MNVVQSNNKSIDVARNLYTYLTRRIVHADRYTLLVGQVVVVQVLDTLVEAHEYIDSTVYQLYTDRDYHRTQATHDKDYTADRYH